MVEIPQSELRWFNIPQVINWDWDLRDLVDSEIPREVFMFLTQFPSNLCSSKVHWFAERCRYHRGKHAMKRCTGPSMRRYIHGKIASREPNDFSLPQNVVQIALSNGLSPSVYWFLLATIVSWCYHFQDNDAHNPCHLSFSRESETYQNRWHSIDTRRHPLRYLCTHLKISIGITGLRLRNHLLNKDRCCVCV